MFAILQGNLLILAEIHLHIVPAGFIDTLIDLVRESRRHGDQALGIVGTIAVAVGHIVALNPQLNAVIRNVEPETEGTCVFKLDRVAVHTESNPAILTGVGHVGGQTVELKTQSILSVMHLAVCFVGQRKRHIIIPRSSLSVVDHIPDVDIRLATLEVKEDVRASAQIELEREGRVAAHIQRGGHVAGKVCRCARLVDSSKIQTDKAAERGVICDKCHVVLAQADLVKPVVDRSLDRNARRLSERNGDDRLIQRDRLGCRDGDLLLADDLAIILHLHGDIALGSVRSEDTVFDSSHALFFDCPLGIGGNVNLGADRIRAECIKGHGAAGGVVIIIAGDGGVREHTVSGGIGDDEDGVGSRALAAVGQ